MITSIMQALWASGNEVLYVVLSVGRLELAFYFFGQSTTYIYRLVV